MAPSQVLKHYSGDMAIDFRHDLIARWPNPLAEHIPLLKDAGIQTVILKDGDSAFQQACSQAGIATLLERDFRQSTFEHLPARSNAGPYVALKGGLWPGISRGGTRASPDDETASASHEPWIDANAYLVDYLRALYPDTAPVLAYEANAEAGLKPDRIVPFESHELALIEARAMGGNYVLSLDPKFRGPLEKGDPKARAAWKRLGETAKWLSQNSAHWQQPVVGTATQVVEPGETTAELANLLYRRNASPRQTTLADLPKPSPAIACVVAASITAPKSELAARVLAHASAGGSVVVDDPAPNAWWRTAGLKQVKKQEDRTFYSCGKGAIVSYNETIVNPSEFALDVIDVVTHPRRSVRIWNANSVIAVGSASLVRLFNYGPQTRGEVQVRIQGHFSSAEYLRPGAAPAQLTAQKRGPTTEVFLTALNQFGAILFR